PEKDPEVADHRVVGEAVAEAVAEYQRQPRTDHAEPERIRQAAGRRGLHRPPARLEYRQQHRDRDEQADQAFLGQLAHEEIVRVHLVRIDLVMVKRVISAPYEWMLGEVVPGDLPE